MFYKLLRKSVNLFHRPRALFLISADRKYKWNGLELLIKKGVFHPGLFYSTKFLLQVIRKENLTGKSFLELGAGSGLLSFYAASAGAVVTASDISTTAIDGLKINLRHLKVMGHKLQLHIFQSDLFDAIPEQQFDYMVINPPYYPKKAGNEAEMAWFCGENFEYFSKLFKVLGKYMQLNSKVFMSLSEDCNLDKIMQIASMNQLKLNLFRKKRIGGELNFIFQVVKN
jgi:release factor glutamine methyltransferase